MIEGAKWCGKTTTAKQIAKSVVSMRNQDAIENNKELANIKPSIILNGATPRLIDEWQIVPKLWDAVRYEVDQRDKFGQFILTSSAIPADISKIYHSGTGRISRLLMRPMSLFESGDSTGSVSLGDLFEGKTDIDGTSEIDIYKLSFLICRGGWPKALNCSEKIVLEQAIDYYDGIINTDISRVDNVERNKDRAIRLIRSYARSIANSNKIKLYCSRYKS